MATLGALAAVIIVPALAVLYREFLPAPRRTVLLASAATGGGAAAVWLVAGLIVPALGASQLHVPATALAVVAAFLAMLPVWPVARGALPALLFSVGWTTLVFVPVAIVVLCPHALGISPLAAPLDLGGAIPVHVTAGAAALLAVLVRRATPSVERAARPPAVTLLAAGLVLWLGWTLLLVGLELQLGEPTSRIVASSLIAPPLAVVGWLVVQRIIARTTTATGATAGLVCGLVAITPGSAYLNAAGAGITGALAGVLCAVFVLRRASPSGDAAWFLVGAHWLAAVVGLALLGIISSDRGFVFTGQVGVLQTQAVAIALVSVWACLVALVVWGIARFTRAGRRSELPVEQPA